MSIRTAISPKLQPLLQRAVQNHGVRPMTVLSKKSAEEYQKQVRIAVVCVSLVWSGLVVFQVPYW